SITVNPVNDGPVALNDAASVDEDSAVTINVLANDSDLDGDALSVTAASAGNGSVSIRPDGSLDYTPNANFNGTDTVTYTISDGNGATDTATVSITVNPVNDGPDAVNDTASVDEDSAVTINVLANDSDIEGDALSVTAASAGNGSVSIRPDGSLDYSPNTNFNGTDTVTYTISDGNGATDTATVTITVNPVNDGPDALNDTASVDEDSAVTINVLANDSDLDGDALSVTAASAGNGSVSIRPDGSLDYTPNANFNGTDTVTYTISDGNGATDTATVSITVNPVNDAVSDLTFTGGTIVETDEPGTVAATATAVDIDTGDTHTYSLVDDGSGRFEIDTNSGDITIKDIDIDADSATVGSGGTLAMWFDPDGIAGSEGDPVANVGDLGANGNDASQGGAGQQPTLTLNGPFGRQGIQFDGVDDVLTVANASEINASTADDKSFVMTLQSGADIETRQVIYEEGGGTNGLNLYIDGGRIYFGTWNNIGGVTTDDASAFVSAEINPYTDYVATFVFDGGAGTLTAYVNGIEIGSQPFAAPLLSHTDGIGIGATNGTSVFHDFTNPAGTENFGGIIGEFAYYDETALSQLDIWGLTHEMSNGEIDPFVDQTEPTIDLVVSTTDGVGPAYTETLTINVSDANFAPGDVVFYNDAGKTTEITVGTVDENSSAGTLVAYLDVADQNPEDTHSFTIAVSDPNFEIVNGNELVLKTGAALDYEADPSHAVTVDVTVTDSDGASYVETFTINLNDVNDPVIAQDDLVTTDEDNAFNGDVLLDNGNGADFDQDGDTITITEINGSSANVGTQIALGSGALLTLNSDGTFDYDPNGQFESLNTGETATDSFTYTVDDGNGSSDTATVTVTIDGVSDAPTAGDVDLGAILEDNSLIITEAQLLANSTDPDSSGGDLSISNVSVSASFGAIVDNMNGTWTFTPVADLHADDLPITFTVEDEGARSDTATATLDITAVADPITSLNINSVTGHYFTQVAFTDGESAPSATVDADGFAFPTFEGWDAPAGKMIEIRNFETSTVGGNWHIEIDDDPSGTFADAGEIFQEFETAAGANYTLSFDWSPRPGFSATINTIEIVWDGQVVAVVSRDGSGLANPDWQNYTINVIGTGDVERLTIREPDYAEANAGRGIFLDNISVMTDGDAQAMGSENTAIDISSIDVTFGPDTDGSEQHILNVNNIPVGAVLADGLGNTFTATAGNTSIDLYDSFGPAANNWDLSSLTVTPPTDFVGNFDLQVTATATEQSNGDTESSAATLTVHVYDGAAIHGDGTANTIVGTSGADHIVGEGGNDTLSGGGFNDYIAGEEGDDIISGDAGYDRLFGGEGNDTISGGTEDDILFGGMGNDSLDGGTGNDIAAFNLDQAAVVANLTTGIATGQGTDTLISIENLTGSDLADTLTGDGGVNILRGGAGNDTISGLAGDDVIEGGEGDDVLSGGDGSDLFFITGDGSHGDDTIQGGAGGGWTDVIQLTNPGVLGTDWSYTLTSGTLVGAGGNFLQFSADAAGDIDFGNDTFNDIAFSDLERIEW
ncbi:MAG: tandem-95 repeat protein, partial [Alphaproteobacteria bacterium]|nr:tandem-95 repeat protein [Alphaproteobacteria bacterium]